MMDDTRKSDSPVVAENSPNKAAPAAAEVTESRGLAEGNSPEHNMLRVRSREGMPSALERVRQAAERDRKQRFTALFHHVYDVERLRAAYLATKRDAAAGVDGETWGHYGENLEANLHDLSARLRRGAYRAKPVKRAYIPKTDGRLRPLGIPALEDRIVQRAVVEVLRTRSKISVRIWTADPSRLASLLVVAIRRVFLLLAPCQPGASSPNS